MNNTSRPGAAQTEHGFTVSKFPQSWQIWTLAAASASAAASGLSSWSRLFSRCSAARRAERGAQRVHQRDAVVLAAGPAGELELDDLLAGIGARDELVGHRRGRGADVDEDRLAARHECGGGAGDRRLLRRVLGGHLFEGTLAAGDVEGHRAAVHPMGEAALLEHLQVVAGGDGADAEALGQLADPHEPLLLQELMGELLTHLGREVVEVIVRRVAVPAGGRQGGRPGN